MAKNWFKSAGAKTALITGIFLLVTTIITLLPKHTVDVPTKDDISFREQIRGILTENQSINSQYADYRKTDLVDSNVSFLEIDTAYAVFITKKKGLLEKLHTSAPTPRYIRLHSLLCESIISDSELFSLERENYASLLSYLHIIQSIPQLDTTNLSKEQIRERAFQSLMDLREKNRTWLERSKERTAKEKVAKSNSIAAIKMLNEELARENLPYEHTNVFLDVTDESARKTDNSNITK